MGLTIRTSTLDMPPHAEKLPKFDLSISLLSFNTKPLLDRCLNSIYRNTHHLSFEILLVDNASHDGTPEMVRRKYPKVKLISNPKNHFFVKGHNQNLRRVSGRYFLVLNEDIEISPGCFEQMVLHLDEHPEIGLLSCRHVDKSGIADISCSRFPHPLCEMFESSFLVKRLKPLIPSIEKKLATYRYKGWKRDTIRSVDVIPGSFMMGRSELLSKVGFFDESSFLFFYSEPDYCFRVRAVGYKVVHHGKISILHLRSQAIANLLPLTRYQLGEHDLLVYYRKYFGILWYFALWLSLRPNWLYWQLRSWLHLP